MCTNINQIHYDFVGLAYIFFIKLPFYIIYSRIFKISYYEDLCIVVNQIVERKRPAGKLNVVQEESEQANDDAKASEGSVGPESRVQVFK